MLRNFLPSIRRRDEVARGDEQAPDFFEQFFGAPFGQFWNAPTALAVDVSDKDDEIIVSAELPGVDPKDVELTLERDILRIRGEKKFEREDKKENSLRRERGYGSFSRSIPLPCAVQSDKIKAEYKNGVLTVTLPKDETAKPQRIAVTA